MKKKEVQTMTILDTDGIIFQNKTIHNKKILFPILELSIIICTR